METAVQSAVCPNCRAVLSELQCGGLCSRCAAATIINPELAEEPRKVEPPVRFDELKLIASGGMGAIYEAQDRKLARSVALKFLHADLVSDPAARMRFEVETLIAGQMEHPAVIPVYDAGSDLDGRPFYVMRRVNGATLHSILQRVRSEDRSALERFTLRTLLNAFQKVCDAVSYAHARRILHRDLKPANVMLGEFGEVFVLDWGLAKPLPGFRTINEVFQDDAFFSEMAGCTRGVSNLKNLRPDTQPNLLMGTVGFMAPEQAEGGSHAADERTDIYGLGGILYSILTLEPPVAGAEDNSVLRRTAAGQIRDPRALQRRSWFRTAVRFPHCPRGRIPARVAAIAMKALAKLPEHRYQQVRELQTDLAAALR